MQYASLEGRPPKELHEKALDANAYFASMIASHHSTLTETLSYLIRRTIFKRPLGKFDGPEKVKADPEELRNIWQAATGNLSLSPKDLSWIYKQVVKKGKIRVRSGKVPADIEYLDLSILKRIGTHPNTPEKIRTAIKGLTLNGHPVVIEEDYQMMEYRIGEAEYLGLAKEAYGEEVNLSELRFNLFPL